MRTATNQSRSLTFYLLYTSSISQHLKTHSCLTSKYGAILPENTPIFLKEKQLKSTNS